MIPRLIYSFLYSIALIFLLPFQYRKRPKQLRRRWLREKFGTSSPELQATGQTQGSAPTIWLHAVSVGEVMAALPLLLRLKEKFPSVTLLVSTITDTGQKVAAEKVPEGTQVLYLPFDLNFILRKALKNIQPSLFITMETELWPNLFFSLKRKKIPLIILNGRISDDSFRGYMKIRSFMKGIIGCVDLFGMQDSVYAERIRALGAPEAKVKVLGNFKFDTRPSENIPEWTKLLSPPVIIAGSTHKGEEEIVIAAYQKLKNDFPELNLIIAPRHPERFEEVKELVQSKNMPYIKRSKLQGLISDCERRTIKGKIIILDAVGELASVYTASDIAIIGGSFIPHGGQNLLEPAYWAKPIICGPHMENFPFVKEFYEKGAALEAGELSLFSELKELLESPEKRTAIGNRAKELFNGKSGAVERAMGEIERFLR